MRKSRSSRSRKRRYGLRNFYEENKTVIQIVLILGALGGAVGIVGLFVLKFSRPSIAESAYTTTDTTSDDTVLEVDDDLTEAADVDNPLPIATDRPRKMAEVTEDLPVQEILRLASRAQELRTEDGKAATGYVKQGTVKLEGRPSMPLKFYFRSPDKMRYTIDMGAHEVTCGFSGDEPWMLAQPNGQSPRFIDLSEKEVREIRLNARVAEMPFVLLSQRERLTKRAETEIVNGQMCYQIDYAHTDHNVTRFSIDKENFLIRQIEFFSDPNSKNSTYVRIEYENFTPVGTAWIPFTERVYEGDKLVNDIQLDSYRVNPGLLSDFFRKPELPGS